MTTLIRRIYQPNSASFMRKFEDAMVTPYGYLILVLKSISSEQDILQTDIFNSVNQQAPDVENYV